MELGQYKPEMNKERCSGSSWPPRDSAITFPVLLT